MSEPRGVVCPDCQSDSSVTETRRNYGSLRRRRACLSAACGRRFTTLEMVAPDYGKSKARTANLVAVPRPRDGLLAVVPRRLVDALRELAASVVTAADLHDGGADRPGGAGDGGPLGMSADNEPPP